jgi:hypothetical protein
MAWPFTTPVAPTFDTGVSAVPTGAPALVPGAGATTVYYVLGMVFTNTTAQAKTVTITDGAGAEVLAAYVVPAKEAKPFDYPFRPLTGIKWSASAAGVNGHIWGY